ncbi:MAG TPA: VanZ family protein [Bacillota bacterium]
MKYRTRFWSIIGLTLVLAGVTAFLVHTSKDVQWSGGFWEQWLRTHLQLQSAEVVFWLRKTAHFLGYGSLALLYWVYFYLWGLRKTAPWWGIVGAALVASLDEYFQSRSAFRSGQPTDVLLDISGAVIFTSVTTMWLRYCKNRVKKRSGSC